jgi:molybdenum cofactor synthesis domain-containing protein
MDVICNIKKLEGSPLHCRIMESIDVISRSIDLYGLAGLALSLNGGKDSTVLLHLIRASVWMKREDWSLCDQTSVPPGNQLESIITFFFDKPDDFPEVVEFTKETSKEYGLDIRIYTSDFFSGLDDLLSSTAVKAIFLGTRRGDPNAYDQQVFSPSSKGWPVFMRINPIMEWSYHDVWEFLLLCKLPYCSLYDQGYTSLGSVDTTFPNAALARVDGNFAPAHLLTDPKLERSGRIRVDGSGTCLNRNDSHRSLSGDMPTIPTAGLVIIGDEILAGKVEELNCKFLLKALRSIGWSVARVSFVGDDVDAISDAIIDLSEKCDAVLTCGGLGPTLDDVTMKAVAKAIGRNVAKSDALEDAIVQHFGEHVTKHHLKMAFLPDGPETVLIEHTLQDGRPSPYPLVRCRNIYILPGVPSVVEKKWPAIRGDLARLPVASNPVTPQDIGSLGEISDRDHSLSSHPSIVRRKTQEIPFQTQEFVVRCSDEAQVAGRMEEIQMRFDKSVTIASYPQEDGTTVVLSLESKDTDALSQATACLRQSLSEDLEILREEASHDHD